MKKYRLLCAIYSYSTYDYSYFYAKDFDTMDEAKSEIKKFEDNVYDANYCLDITGIFGYLTNIMGILEVD